MSQDFELKFDEFKENNPGAQVTTGDENTYRAHGNVRNLGFAWPDGRKLFLNYAYLVSCEYQPTEGTITLAFTTHTVILKGIRLEKLFDELMLQTPRIIICVDERYNSLKEIGAVVNQIEVSKNGI